MIKYMLKYEIYFCNFHCDIDKAKQMLCCRSSLNSKLFAVIFMFNKIDLGKYNKIIYYQSNA